MRLTVEDSELETYTADSRGRVTLGSDYSDESVTLAVPNTELSISEIQPFHVRHNGPDLSVAGLKAMAGDRRFGIHWGDHVLTSKWYYYRKAEERNEEDEQRKGANDDINNVHRVTENGGLVSVEYGDIWPSLAGEVMLLGRVLPGTPIQPRKYEFTDGQEAWEEYMKTVELVDVVEASRDDYDELWEKKPPRGSIRRWQTYPETPRDVYQDLR
jgi:hypothetical protein